MGAPDGRNLAQAIDTILAGGTFFGSPPKPEAGEERQAEPRNLYFCGALARIAQMVEHGEQSAVF